MNKYTKSRKSYLQIIVTNNYYGHERYVLSFGENEKIKKIRKDLLTNNSYKYYGHERYVLSFGENLLIRRGIGERG